MGNKRENILRSVRFDGPEYIPMEFRISRACRHHYPQQSINELIESHTFLFPDFDGSSAKVQAKCKPWERADKPYVDGWGCVRETTDDGIMSTVTKHPLDSWDSLDEYAPPDPNVNSGLGPIDWDDVSEQLREANEQGELATGGLRHGHTFLQLVEIRGYENLIFDMADEEPRLYNLITMVERFNMEIIRRFVDLGAECLVYPEDLGMQSGPMLSPEHLKKYIKPSYQRLMAAGQVAGRVIHMHCDGDIRQLAEDLISCGVEVINLQDLVNGIDWIAGCLKGRICVDLDIDRQRITRFGRPDQIEALIRHEVEKLGSREGGLMMTFELFPGVPIENVKAVMDAMEKYAGYYS